MQRCFLVGAAPEAAPIAPQPGDFVIAADGGYAHLLRQGVVPDLIVGDMDSVAQPLPGDIPRVTAPAEKDDTDLVLAFWEGHRRGFRHFVLTGAGGGRIDHHVASLQLLVKAARLGARAVMQDEAFSATVLAGPGELRLGGRGTVSVFAYGEQAAGVTIEGMKYNIACETLLGDTPRGVSNELDGDGRIALQEGVLLIFWETGIVTI